MAVSSPRRARPRYPRSSTAVPRPRKTDSSTSGWSRWPATTAATRWTEFDPMSTAAPTTGPGVRDGSTVAWVVMSSGGGVVGASGGRTKGPPRWGSGRGSRGGGLPGRCRGLGGRRRRLGRRRRRLAWPTRACGLVRACGSLRACGSWPVWRPSWPACRSSRAWWSLPGRRGLRGRGSLACRGRPSCGAGFGAVTGFEAVAAAGVAATAAAGSRRLRQSPASRLSVRLGGRRPPGGGRPFRACRRLPGGGRLA